jgi:hypothetical protein
MVGNAPRYAAGSRDDIDVNVSLVLATEGDIRAVRGKNRIAFDPGAGCKSHGDTAFPRDRPKIAGMRENNLSLAESRLSE